MVCTLFDALTHFLANTRYTDNFQMEFGRRYLTGYETEGSLMCDIIQATAK